MLAIFKVGPNECADFYKLLITNYTVLFKPVVYTLFILNYTYVFEYVECIMCVCMGGCMGRMHAKECVDVRRQLWNSWFSPFACDT